MQRRGGSRGGTGRITAALLFAACLLVLAGCERRQAKYPVVSARDGEVLVDLRGIAPGAGRFFTYHSVAGKPVDHLVYRDSAGAPHAVLDACRTCYRWKKGYILGRGEVLCVKCDMRFKLDALEQGTGSCVPIRLNAAQRGETLVIPVAELEAGARYF